jgi:glycosyltransferase involved in cell wall biosynthesis/putative flippase GtrA
MLARHAGRVRVAIVTEVWTPTVNGVVTRLLATVDDLMERGHEVLVICPAPGAEGACRPGGPEVRTVPTVSLSFVYGGQPWGLPAPAVKRHLADFSPDVVHVVNPVSLGVAGVAGARRLGIPLVCSYHTDIEAYAPLYRLGWLRPVIRWHLRRQHARASLNLVTSSAGAAKLHDLGVGIGDGPGQVQLWCRGVDLERFRPGGDRPVPPSPGRIRALYAGRVAGEKNLDDLAALAACPEFHLTVVGDGPALGQVRGRLGTGVHFTGSLDPEGVARAYRDADVFVFPSVSETLGLVLLEAMASGLPVVAADSPASRELLSGRPAARLWPPGAAADAPRLARELLASAPPPRLAAWARAEVEGRTWSAATEELLGHYRRTVELAAEALPPAGPARPRRGAQLRRFALIGGLNAGLDLALFNVLLLVHPTRAAATLVGYNTVAVIAALVNSYVCNSRWTFRHLAAHPGRRWRQRVLFGTQGILNIVVNDLVVAVVTAALNSGTPLPATVAGNVAKVTAMVAASAVSFVAMRHVVFGRAGGCGPDPVRPVSSWPRRSGSRPGRSRPRSWARTGSPR